MPGPLIVAPAWDHLYEIAAAQGGLFTTSQAAEAGYSPQLLNHHLRGGRVLRVRRGVYRLVHFPAGEHEELVVVWLWSEQAGVFSHETALSLHGLSDLLPARVHITLPAAWKKRRFRVPEGVTLHHDDVSSEQRAWVGPVPLTSVTRTLEDLAASGLSPEVLGRAARQAVARGLTTVAELPAVRGVLAPYGGIPS